MKNQPSVGIGGVFVLESATGTGTLSDSLGNFVFSSLPARNAVFILSKSGYSNDTIRATVQAGGTVSVQSALNALSTVNGITVQTKRIARYFPSTLYYANFGASVSDLNGIGDIDSVWLVIDSLLFPMNYSVNEKKFIYTLYPNEIPSNNLQTLIGKSLSVRVRDMGKAVASGAPFFVTRIIEEEPKLQTTDTSSAAPLFVWNELKASFNFSYTLTLSRDDGGSKTVIWTKTGIPSFLLSMLYDGTALGLGSYSWTLSVIDDFGNSSTSKELNFIWQK